MSWAFRSAAAISGSTRTRSKARPAVVNETFARRFYPGQDAIGKRFNFRGPDNPLWEIVGVVPEGKYNSLGEDPKPAVFLPFFRDFEGGATLVARGHWRSARRLERVAHRRATARSRPADLQPENAHRTHGHLPLSRAHGGDRPRQLRRPRAPARRRRHLRRHVARRRRPHPRDRPAHGPRRAACPTCKN